MRFHQKWMWGGAGGSEVKAAQGRAVVVLNWREALGSHFKPRGAGEAPILNDFLKAKQGGEMGTLVHRCGNVKCSSPCGKQRGDPSKKH